MQRISQSLKLTAAQKGFDYITRSIPYPLPACKFIPLLFLILTNRRFEPYYPFILNYSTSCLYLVRLFQTDANALFLTILPALSASIHHLQSQRYYMGQAHKVRDCPLPRQQQITRYPRTAKTATGATVKVDA
ncbi:hypothetical protein Barb6_02823 [Bacteroidales bacterium Barb6]|nr:hypothetical protein Barb6_02823 [Bacteroidales bacterium Barb6]